ncbi:MAG: TatD family hydrolase, partial [Candidatus Odinarchaeota archaeon]
MYIDCHAHIFFTAIPIEAIDKDITGEIPTPSLDFITRMVFNAKKNGVDYIIGVISNPEDFTSYRSQLEFEDTIHVIGISRGNASKDHSQMISLLQKEIEIQKPHGIGEIGLDYSYGFN